MDDYRLSEEELSNLMRIGIGGDARQFTLIARKLARRFKREDLPLGSKIMEFVAQAGSDKGAAMRRAPQAPPTDGETRRDLLIETNDPKAPEPILPNALREELDFLILEQRQRRKLEKAGLHPARTGLFIGPPGVGKTMTAHWIAAQLKRPLYVLNLSAISSSLLGRTGANLRDALEYAQSRPSVLLIDEFDAVAKGRDADDIGEAKRIVTVLLQEIDRWPSHSVLLAASNHGELLDRAVWRRFDVRIEFPIATFETALGAAKVALGGMGDKRIAKIVARLFENRPLSDVAHAVLTARKRGVLLGEDLEDAVLRQVNEEGTKRDRKSARSLALTLIEAGVSQRKASDLTGVSRDTLRKSLLEQTDG